jgi:hypothetical protein
VSYNISIIVPPLRSLDFFSEFLKEKVLPYGLSNPSLFLPNRFSMANYEVFLFLPAIFPIAQKYYPLIRFIRS